MTIGEKIKYLRNKLNITQSSLANKTNIHPVTIRKKRTSVRKKGSNIIMNTYDRIILINNLKAGGICAIY